MSSAANRPRPPYFDFRISVRGNRFVNYLPDPCLLQRRVARQGRDYPLISRQRAEVRSLKQMKQKRRMAKFARYLALVQSGTSQSIDRKPALFNER
jgi:hypothetical protein